MLGVKIIQQYTSFWLNFWAILFLWAGLLLTTHSKLLYVSLKQLKPLYGTRLIIAYFCGVLAALMLSSQMDFSFNLSGLLTFLAFVLIVKGYLVWAFFDPYIALLEKYRSFLPWIGLIYLLVGAALIIFKPI